MTSREKFLLQVMGIAVLGALGLAGTATYLDGLATFNTRFASMQKEALRLQRQLSSFDDSVPTRKDPLPLLYPKGGLPEPTVLAARVKAALSGTGVRGLELQLAGSSPQSFTLRYTFETRMEQFFRAFATLRQKDPYLIVQRLTASASAAASGEYSLVWEVGYAALP